MLRSTPELILQRLEWQVIRPLDGILQGDYRSLFYGFGLDLADLREYQPGDDIRYIDWNVTARMSTPYVRQYHEDREVTAWFLLDLSPSQDFGTVDVLKRNLLIDTTSLLARLLTRHGNRVGAILYNSQVEKIIPARGGRNHVLQLTHELLNPPATSRPAPTDLCVLLEAARKMIRRRSLVFVISDFFSAPGWEKPLRLLTQHHEVLAVRVADPRESDMPDLGLITVEDSETGEQILVDTHDRNFRRRFREAAARHEAQVNQTFRAAKVEVLSLSTEEDLVQAIVRFSGMRKQKLRK